MTVQRSRAAASKTSVIDKCKKWRGDGIQVAINASQLHPGLGLLTNLREVWCLLLLLKAPSSVFTSKNLLRHYAKQASKHIGTPTQST